MTTTSTTRKLPTNDPLKQAAIGALKRVVDPMIDLMFDTGVTVHEYCTLVRESAVRAAARRVSKEIGRDSKSRVAIMTGLPRSEVARILRSGDASAAKRYGQHPGRRVLAAWFDDPRFLTPHGDPAVLPIFGKRCSFEQLVAMHSGGIPVRAMLDELIQIHAVEQLSDQRVRARSRIPILTGLTAGAISAIGERTRDLLETLTNNLRRTSAPLFEGTALIEESDLELVSLIRREIAEQGANFINSANSLFSRSRVQPKRPTRKSSTKCRLGVTVYYFQDDIEEGVEPKAKATYSRRKNLQRQRRTTNRKRKAAILRRSIANERL
jgi:hypothetical protein